MNKEGWAWYHSTILHYFTKTLTEAVHQDGSKHSMTTFKSLCGKYRFKYEDLTSTDELIKVPLFWEFSDTDGLTHVRCKNCLISGGEMDDPRKKRSVVEANISV